ncbi:MAG: alpha-ketoacid dehydrogenase subunit beta [Actinobacteria bacterium]|nr:alpha-ketoacid dehydrogenase subunit beta [Actinomycetota bacterium]
MSATYAEAIRQALAEELERDPNVFLIGEDIGESGGVFGATKGLWERFGPDRLLDTPISEEAVVGAAVGASLIGGRPVVEIMFGDFAALAMDMIVNQAAKIHYMTGGQLCAPLVVRMVTGTAGATAAQHSQSLEAWFVHTPGLKVAVPSTPEDAYVLLKEAIEDPDPVIFFEHKMLYSKRSYVPLATSESSSSSFGTGRIRREGSDVTIVSYLKTLDDALQAAGQLELEGISCEVFDPRTLVPFDRDGLASSLAKTGRLVIAHEAPVRAGVGAEIAAIAAAECFDLLTAPIARVGGLNTPVPYAPEMEHFTLPDADRIASTVRSVLEPREPLSASNHKEV